MKRRAIGGLILGAFSLAPLSVTAQQATPDPRKPFYNDDGKPIPRAIPVQKPIPRAIPVERGAATPAPDTGAAPKPAGPPEPEEPGTIRMTPGGTPRTADQIQLDLADGYYAKKLWDQAAPEYERYLGLYPNGQDREAAYFRLAESYRHLGTMNAAKTAYETLLQNYGSGEFIGPASYRLADIYYGEKEFRDALTLYRKASVRVKEPAVANAAKFFSARCLEGLGEKLEARITYEDLVAAPKDNPFYDASRLSLALLLKDGGRTADALKQIQALARQTENSDLKLEATVRSGLWSLELDPPLTPQADAAFKAALALPGKGYWKELAELGQVRILSDASKFDQVLDACDKMGGEVSTEIKPELLMLKANAQRQLNKHADALTTYAEVTKEFPDTVYDKDAQYQRLRTMYATNDENLVPEIDKYLQANPEEQKRDEVSLMKAEVLFKKEDYAGAMEIYSVLELSRQLSGNRKAEALFRLGWCEIQTKNLEKAIKTFTSFINGYSTNKLVPFALLQRGLASQSLKDLSGALKDYDAIVKGYPKAPQRELALQQQALIQGQQGNNAAMAESFKQLIKEFPDTAARAQADYWIGWAAFENKNYKEALPHLEEARKRDKEQYGEKAGIRVLLSEYYLEDKDATGREADLYAKEGKTKVPPEILRWLGKSFHDAGSHESAEKYLVLLTGREEVMPEDFQVLAESQIALGKFQPAVSSMQSYLKSTKLPVPRAKGLLLLAQAQTGLGAYDDAQKSVDEALTLQPEGEVSGLARMAAGDIQMARKNYEEAAKIYESVAVILDDPVITPQALEKAVAAWRSAGKIPESEKTLNKLRSRYPEYKLNEVTGNLVSPAKLASP
jgi:TolA-binding protein